MDLKSFKEKKQRGLSVKDALEEVNNYAEIEEVVIVAIGKHGAIDISYSCDDNARLIGYLDIAKSAVTDSILYPE